MMILQGAPYARLAALASWSTCRFRLLRGVEGFSFASAGRVMKETGAAPSSSKADRAGPNHPFWSARDSGDGSLRLTPQAINASAASAAVREKQIGDRVEESSGRADAGAFRWSSSVASRWRGASRKIENPHHRIGASSAFDCLSCAVGYLGLSPRCRNSCAAMAIYR